MSRMVCCVACGQARHVLGCRCNFVRPSVLDTYCNNRTIQIHTIPITTTTAFILLTGMMEYGVSNPSSTHSRSEAILMQSINFNQG
ncbi:hypothetical protein BCR39DRAFT_93370 [Naematelia encephala]|uniref:Uncharacterized protein n=1 Tax=Naematelia encephala TaxID=71784 RepID=A0A1Y2BA96_9TREE|nr:hypothetical protein BCR39DRAFT_93370 [Naematelia encephala]